MSWQSITITVPGATMRDVILGEFSGDPTVGVWERPREDGTSDIVFYFHDGQVPSSSTVRICELFERNGCPVPEVRVGTVPEEDWTSEWRKGFSSFTIGRRFRVVPGWETPPADDSRMSVRIDPGMAFGTGTHETTQSVIEILEALPLGPTALDPGTGSGILAMAAVRLGIAGTVACDVDPDAVAVARSNFERNGIRVPLFVGSVDAVADRSMAIVLANLTSDVIVSNLGHIARVLVADGQAVFSGVLVTQQEGVEAEMARIGFSVIETVVRGEWISFRVGVHGR